MESRPATRDCEMADDDPDAEDPTIDDAADAALKAAAPGVGGGMNGGVAAADTAGWRRGVGRRLLLLLLAWAGGGGGRTGGSAHSPATSIASPPLPPPPYTPCGRTSSVAPITKSTAEGIPSSWSPLPSSPSTAYSSSQVSTFGSI